MRYQILGDSDNPLLEVALAQNETIRLERGAMVYMQDVSLEGKLNANSGGLGGMFKALGRSISSGESMFISEATGTSNEALIGIAPSVTGCIRHLEVGAKQYRLNTGAFLACDSGVQYHMIAQKGVGKVLFGGTGGLFVMETSGSGNLFVNAFGDMMELEVRPGRSLVIDNGHVVAWDSTLNYQIRIASGTFGFKSGEGLVNEFSGSGRVLIQTRNVKSLADALTPYLPKSSN